MLVGIHVDVSDHPPIFKFDSTFSEEMMRGR